MKKIIMFMLGLNCISFLESNLVSCSAADGNEIKIDYTHASASTSESKEMILKQIIYPLLQTLNISHIKFSNGVKWTQAQINNSLLSQKEILKTNKKSGVIWNDFFNKYQTAEDYSFTKVEIPWSLENIDSINKEGKREKKIATVSEVKPIIDQFNNDINNPDYVKSNAQYEKANNYALVKLKSSYLITIIYEKQYKFSVELKNLTALLQRLKYKENNDDKWEWFFVGYQFKKHDVFPEGKDYIVTKKPSLYRPTLSETNFPVSDLEFDIINDSIEKIS